MLIVEDDIDLATAIIDYMELEGIETDYAADGQIGLNLIISHDYDVVLLDINLPKIEGLAVCERIRARGIDTPVLMLTARDTLDDKLIGFSKGADDYLVKPFAMEELIARVNVLSRRKSGQVTRMIVRDLSFDVMSREVLRGERVIKLSPIATKILELLMRESPNAVSREKIIRHIWGDDTPDSNSLKVHIFNLRKQIDEDSSPSMVHTIPSYGFAIK